MNPMNPNFRELVADLERIKKQRKIRDRVWYVLMAIGTVFTIYMLLGGHL